MNDTATMETNAAKRPIGLMIMALANALFGMAGAVVFVLTLIKHDIFEGRELAGEVYLVLAIRMLSLMAIFFAAVGYVRLSKSQGRLLGNIYAILALAYVILDGVMFEGFTATSLLWFPYPLLTLFFLNTTYANSFTRR
jgi:hypothetical protein